MHIASDTFEQSQEYAATSKQPISAGGDGDGAGGDGGAVSSPQATLHPSFHAPAQVVSLLVQSHVHVVRSKQDLVGGTQDLQCSPHPSLQMDPESRHCHSFREQSHAHMAASKQPIGTGVGAGAGVGAVGKGDPDHDSHAGPQPAVQTPPHVTSVLEHWHWKPSKQPMGSTGGTHASQGGPQPGVQTPMHVASVLRQSHVPPSKQPLSSWGGGSGARLLPHHVKSGPWHSATVMPLQHVLYDPMY